MNILISLEIRKLPSSLTAPQMNGLFYLCWSSMLYAPGLLHVAFKIKKSKQPTNEHNTHTHKNHMQKEFVQQKTNNKMCCEKSKISQIKQKMNQQSAPNFLTI